MGSTIILNTLLQTTGNYLNQLPSMSLWSATNHGTQWQSQWTTFFWPWWMSWAPFVGMFIARISRGRTVRELVAGALIIPTAINFIWISVFGGSALFHELQALASYDNFSNVLGSLVPFSGGDILHTTQQSVPSAVFKMYDEAMPASTSSILSFLTVILLGSYFITSADSGTLVLCILDAEGNPRPPQFIRVIWGVLIGGVATGLVYAGGLQAIKSASIIAGLPIAILLVIVSLTLFSDMKANYRVDSGDVPRAEGAVSRTT